MKVKDLIKELEQLDQDKNIYIVYDGGYNVFPPIPDCIAEEDGEYDSSIMKGDYIITAG